MSAAERTIANSITNELRRPWHVHSFDYRGNLAPMSSPFRLTAHAVKAPHTFVERYAWAVTDPDEALNVPAFAWSLTEHKMLAALARFPLAQQAEWREYLNAPGHPNAALPFKKDRNRHGTFTMRRTHDTSPGAAEVAAAFASAATVTRLADRVYREAFPVDVWRMPQGVDAQRPTVNTVDW